MHRRAATDRREPVELGELLAGILSSARGRSILGAISLDLFAVLLGGATALLPIYARDILHVGAWGLGLLRSMPAAGAVSMAMLLAHRPLDRHTGRRMLQAVAVFGVATDRLRPVASMPLSLACLFVLGAADMISVFVRQTLVQLETPDAMRGRVAAVNAVFIGASNELGEFELGTLAGSSARCPRWCRRRRHAARGGPLGALVPRPASARPPHRVRPGLSVVCAAQTLTPIRLGALQHDRGRH